MIINRDLSTYLDKVVTALDAHKIPPRDLTHKCYECGIDFANEQKEYLDYEYLKEFHVLYEGNVVLVGCEGYWMVNPNYVGIYRPNWEPPELIH